MRRIMTEDRVKLTQMLYSYSHYVPGKGEVVFKKLTPEYYEGMKKLKKAAEWEKAHDLWLMGLGPKPGAMPEYACP